VHHRLVGHRCHDYGQRRFAADERGRRVADRHIGEDPGHEVDVGQCGQVRLSRQLRAAATRDEVPHRRRHPRLGELLRVRDADERTGWFAGDTAIGHVRLPSPSPVETGSTGMPVHRDQSHGPISPDLTILSSGAVPDQTINAIVCCGRCGRAAAFVIEKGVIAPRARAVPAGVGAVEQSGVFGAEHGSRSLLAAAKTCTCVFEWITKWHRRKGLELLSNAVDRVRYIKKHAARFVQTLRTLSGVDVRCAVRSWNKATGTTGFGNRSTRANGSGGGLVTGGVPGT
jgi:hypothetical protein